VYSFGVHAGAMLNGRKPVAVHTDCAFLVHMVNLFGRRVAAVGWEDDVHSGEGTHIVATDFEEDSSWLWVLDRLGGDSDAGGGT
jgi:hypothetical protein